MDRTACPWLIKRFVDPNAEFIFIPTENIEEVVKKESAIPYDVPNAELGHHGEKCSFDASSAKRETITLLTLYKKSVLPKSPREFLLLD